MPKYSSVKVYAGRGPGATHRYLARVNKAPPLTAAKVLAAVRDTAGTFRYTYAWFRVASADDPAGPETTWFAGPAGWFLGPGRRRAPGVWEWV